jgi:hypothetical protein
MKWMLAMLAAAALAPLAASAQQGAAEGRLAQLYAARPPAGSAFVRVLNPGNAALEVGIGNGAAQRIGPATRATRYAIVEGGKPFALRVAGTARVQAQVAAGSFTTLVLDAATPSRPLAVLADGGVRSGLDVVRMLALGAHGVLLGRAWVYALAAAGEAGEPRIATRIATPRTVAVLAMTSSTVTVAVPPPVASGTSGRSPWSAIGCLQGLGRGVLPGHPRQ